MTQICQGLCSTNPKCINNTPASPLEEPLPPVSSNEVHICVEHIIKLRTDDMGRLPIRSCSDNQYIIMTCHCDTNIILVKPFNYKKELHHIAAYKSIMIRLQQRGHKSDLHVFDNKASQE